MLSSDDAVAVSGGWDCSWITCLTIATADDGQDNEDAEEDDDDEDDDEDDDDDDIHSDCEDDGEVDGAALALPDDAPLGPTTADGCNLALPLPPAGGGGGGGGAAAALRLPADGLDQSPNRLHAFFHLHWVHH
uniref:Uncharacterized protein n=1 Tax=Anopheles melas TaxID=34690 RepID=A0A182TD94_9DIPT